MKWLIVVLAFIATTAQAELGVKYIEHALYMTVTKGEQAGKVVCLDNKTYPRDGLPAGWKVMTCNSLHTPEAWAICFINIEKRSFICGKKTPA